MKLLKKCISLICIICMVSCSCVAVSAEKELPTEMDVIDRFLGSEFLNILPENHHGQTLTRAEMVEILAKFTQIQNDENLAYFYYYTDQPVRSLYVEYSDPEISEEFEDLALRMNFVQIMLPGENGILNPDELCTFKTVYQAVESIANNCRVNVKQTSETNRGNRQIRIAELGMNFDEDDVEIYDVFKKMLFYCLFTTLMQNNRWTAFVTYNELTVMDDWLHILYDCKFKIGYAKCTGTTLEIDELQFNTDIRIDESVPVLCVYDEDGDDKKIRFCMNVPLKITENIKLVRGWYGSDGVFTQLSAPDKTDSRERIFEPDSDDISNVAKNFEDYKGLKKSYIASKVYFWEDNPDNTVTRAQIAKTALQMCQSNFYEYDMESEFKVFKDVSPETVLYHNYINALWQAGVIRGDGNGNFYPYRACTYGELIKILSCLTGWGKYAEEVADENGVNAFPEAYKNVIEEFNLAKLDYDINYSDTAIKDILPELVYTFMNIPTYTKTENGWVVTPSLYARYFVGI